MGCAMGRDPLQPPVEHSFIQRPVHPSFGRVKPLWTGINMGGRVVDEQKKVFQNRRYCQLCLKSECVCSFKSSDRFKVCKLA